MLSIKLLNTKVAQHFLEVLYSPVIDDMDLVILQDRQSAPRPTDESGNLRNYVYYRVDAPRTLQWQTKRLQEKDGTIKEITIAQKQLRLKLNFLGQRANDAANYFNHAINSNLAYDALRPVINGVTYEFQYNGHTDPVDLTEVEQTKWLARVEYDVLLGYIDSADFNIDVFTDVETEVDVSDGLSVKPIIVTTIGE